MCVCARACGCVYVFAARCARTCRLINHISSSVVAGFVTAVCSCPLDTIKTRVMNQPCGPDGRGLLCVATLGLPVQITRPQALPSMPLCVVIVMYVRPTPHGPGRC